MTASEIIAAVLAWQSDPHHHPLTCRANHLHRKLQPLETAAGAVVLACPDCDSHQDPVPGFVVKAAAHAGYTNRFDYARDDTRGRIRVVAHSPLQAADLVAILDRQVSEGTWSFGILYDLSGIQGATARADSLVISDLVRSYVRTYGERGRVAMVTRDAMMRGVGQTYAQDVAPSGVSIQLFGDLADAESWLDQPR